jgi:ferredoxin
MANKTAKVPKNVAGKFYVDTNCISCGQCVELAPNHFSLDDTGFAFVKKQPNSPQEDENCQNALSACPVEAIGNDGE